MRHIRRRDSDTYEWAIPSCPPTLLRGLFNKKEESHADASSVIAVYPFVPL